MATRLGRDKVPKEPIFTEKGDYIMEDKDIRDLVSKLSSIVNPFNFEHEKFTSAVLNEHRTLQQSIFRLFIKTISQWSKLPENHYDLRNEYTVLTSKKIMKELEGYDGAPFI